MHDGLLFDGILRYISGVSAHCAEWAVLCASTVMGCQWDASWGTPCQCDSKPAEWSSRLPALMVMSVRAWESSQGVAWLTPIWRPTAFPASAE